MCARLRIGMWAHGGGRLLTWSEATSSPGGVLVVILLFEPLQVAFPFALYLLVAFAGYPFLHTVGNAIAVVRVLAKPFSGHLVDEPVVAVAEPLRVGVLGFGVSPVFFEGLTFRRLS